MLLMGRHLLWRYLVWDIIKPASVALIAMLALVWLLQSLRFLDLMINKGLSIITFLQLTLLLVPFLLIIIAPLALFAGLCYAFRRWQDENELTGLFSAGFSRQTLLQPAGFAALVFVALSYSMSLYLLPISTTTFKDLQHQLRHSEGHLLLEESTFNQIGGDVMVYLKKRLGPMGLDTLLVHDTRKDGRPVTWMARKGEVNLTADGFPRLTLNQGIRQEVTNNRVSMLEFKEHTLDVTRQFETPPDRIRDAKEYTPAELQAEAKRYPHRYDEYQAEYQTRFMWPLAPLPLLLIASIALLKPQPRRSGMLRATALATVAAFAYIAAMMTLANMAKNGDTLVLYGQWLLPLCVCTIGAWMIRRELRHV